MPTIPLLAACCLTLGLALASNPDSEIFEDPTQADQDGTTVSTQRSQKMLDGRPPSSDDDEEEPGDTPLSVAISPIRTGTFVTKEVLRQVLPNGMVSVERRYSFDSRQTVVKSADDRPSAAFGDRIVSRNTPLFGVRSSYGGFRGFSRPTYGYQQSVGSNPQARSGNAGDWTNQQGSGWMAGNNNNNDRNYEQVPQRMPANNENSGQSPQRMPINMNRANEQVPQGMPVNVNRANEQDPQRMPVNTNNEQFPQRIPNNMNNEQVPQRMPINMNRANEQVPQRMPMNNEQVPQRMPINTNRANEQVPQRMPINMNNEQGSQRMPINMNNEQGSQRMPINMNNEQGSQRMPTNSNRNRVRVVSVRPHRDRDNRVSSGTLNAERNQRLPHPRRPVYRQFLVVPNRPTRRPNNNNNRTSNFGGYSRPQANVPNPPPTNAAVSPDTNLYSGIVNDFAFGLVDLLDPQTNFVVSPLSIFVALAMCYLGSGGSTKNQLENFMGLNLNSVHDQRLHEGIRDLIRTVQTRSSDANRLAIANAMFLGRQFSVGDQFRSEVERYYGAELANLDFADAEASVAAINRWVSRATGGAIESVGGGQPPPQTSLALLNAVYFRGTWKKQFPTNMTYIGRFFMPDGKDKMVPTMPLYGETFAMHRSDAHRHTFLKIPYQGDQVSMIIALPFTFRDRPMPSNSDRTLCHVRDALRDSVLDTVTVPKFRADFTTSLKSSLERMGVTDIFNARSADFGRLSPAEGVVVTDIVHKAVVEVSERGTTASASTSVRFVPLAFKNTTDFVVNHPFAYYVVHEPSGLVLFYGKVYDLGVDPADVESQ